MSVFFSSALDCKWDMKVGLYPALLGAESAGDGGGVENLFARDLCGSFSLPAEKEIKRDNSSSLVEKQ